MSSLALLPSRPLVDDLGGAAALGVVLRLLRTEAGITQRELAARENLHRNYLGALERGTVANPGLATADRLARALGVSVGVLAESFVRPLPGPRGNVGRVGAPASRADVPARPATRRAGAPAAFKGAPAPPSSEAGAEVLGRALRRLRCRHELTRVSLAQRTGMHKNYIGSLEDGAIASPGLMTVTRLVLGLQGSARDVEALATSVGLLARVFAGEPVQARAIAA